MVVLAGLGWTALVLLRGCAGLGFGPGLALFWWCFLVVVVVVVAAAPAAAAAPARAGLGWPDLGWADLFQNCCAPPDPLGISTCSCTWSDVERLSLW